ncbi:MAG: hypothetical protein OER95_14445 [Acidimicrobiia bacterium]|nr:hypothetical protein [Acidimicrobiia bacterium]
MELTNDEVAAITEVVAAAGRQALQWFRPSTRGSRSPFPGTAGVYAGAGESQAPLLVENKQIGTVDFDPVTEADRAVETVLRDAIRSMFPGDAITGEEFGAEGSGRRRWLIDPVDGTRAFIAGQPMWGTLVGLMVDRVPIAGWMHLPVLDETYVGLGDRAHLSLPVSRPVPAPGPRDTVSVATASTTELADAVLLCTHPSMFAPGREWERFAVLASTVKMTRYGGDCMNYGLVASGDADLVVENQLAVHDIVPLIPIISGAGGVVTDLDGNTPIEGGFVVAAATPELHRAALDVLNG